MIKYNIKNEYYWLYSQNNIWIYWPFESVFVKWEFLWKKFNCDISNLKTWKHCIWYYNWRIFLFEEINDKLFLKNI